VLCGWWVDAACPNGPIASADVVFHELGLRKTLRHFAGRALAAMGRFHSLLTQTDQGAGRLLFAAARRLSFELLEARQLLDAAALPVPLTPIEPLGSLAFETSAAASID